MVTAKGQKALLGSIAGTATFGNSLGFGVGSTAPSLTDISLEYELLRVPVNAKIVKGNSIIFTATIPAEEHFTFYEVGVFGSSALDMDLTLSTFNNTIEVIDGGSNTGTNVRVGGAGIISTGTVTVFISADLSDGNPRDYFSLACYSATNKSVTLKFYSGSSYFSQTKTINNGYKILDYDKKDFTTSGTPSWDNIDRIDVVGAVTLDGLKLVKSASIVDSQVDVRMIIDGGEKKYLGQQVEIEIEVPFNSWNI